MFAGCGHCGSQLPFDPFIEEELAVSTTAEEDEVEVEEGDEGGRGQR